MSENYALSLGIGLRRGASIPTGQPQTDKQKAGLVYSPDRQGLFVTSHLPTLIKEVRTAPNGLHLTLGTRV